MVVVLLSKEAEGDFIRLPKVEKEKVIRKLDLLRNDPLLGKLLMGELKEFRSLRVWPYRILYEFRKTRVIIHRILHRQRAYKR